MTEEKLQHLNFISKQIKDIQGIIETDPNNPDPEAYRFKPMVSPCTRNDVIMYYQGDIAKFLFNELVKLKKEFENA